jgi:hypothetical protein
MEIVVIIGRQQQTKWVFDLLMCVLLLLLTFMIYNPSVHPFSGKFT